MDEATAPVGPAGFPEKTVLAAFLAPRWEPSQSATMIGCCRRGLQRTGRWPTGWSFLRSTTMPAKIHIERMMYRNSIAVQGQTAASYALIKLIPAAEGATGPLGLNLALVLDVSGSMYEEDGTGVSRLKRMQQAASDAIDKLKPDDTLAIVAFAH